MCMLRLSSSGHSQFLPKLEDLKVSKMGPHGLDRLLAAIGPSLTHLGVDLPYNETSDVAGDSTHMIPLGRFPNLSCLDIYLWKIMDGRSTRIQPSQAMLASWASAIPRRKLRFAPIDQSQFTREEYSALLTTIGNLAEQSVYTGKSDANPLMARARIPDVTFTIVLRDDIERYGCWRRETAYAQAEPSPC
ncbi:hypothetical protein BD310DRAFT_927345 [Dichomitus squalens]|uniref:Uncharacterized protein n=1 Tax=Dichomitus squalens TaxID=114155 RepID=A0A4V2K820_9APHY|nr:hypothetical protein BD310DRAFT_927345 [Dichomitus squalens]